MTRKRKHPSSPAAAAAVSGSSDTSMHAAAAAADKANASSSAEATAAAATPKNNKTSSASASAAIRAPPPPPKRLKTSSSSCGHTGTASGSVTTPAVAAAAAAQQGNSNRASSQSRTTSAQTATTKGSDRRKSGGNSNSNGASAQMQPKKNMGKTGLPPPSSAASNQKRKKHKPFRAPLDPLRPHAPLPVESAMWLLLNDEDLKLMAVPSDDEDEEEKQEQRNQGKRQDAEMTTKMESSSSRRNANKSADGNATIAEGDDGAAEKTKNMVQSGKELSFHDVLKRSKEVAVLDVQKLTEAEVAENIRAFVQENPKARVLTHEEYGATEDVIAAEVDVRSQYAGERAGSLKSTSSSSVIASVSAHASATARKKAHEDLTLTPHARDMVPLSVPRLPIVAGEVGNADGGDATATSILSLALLRNYAYHAHGYRYYVHPVGWDRRMDRWVLRGDLRFRTEVESQLANLLAAESGSSITTDSAKLGKTGSNMLAAAAGGSAVAPIAKYIPQNAGRRPSKKALASQLLRQSAVGVQHDAHGDEHAGFTEEDLRLHEEATKVKNVDVISLGRHEIDCWYFSPFPVELKAHKKLYFCEFCLSYFAFDSELWRHQRKCTLRHPPGNEIYRSKETNIEVAMFEIDGAKERVYCENLCLIAKLFLDHKTLEYDCTPFLFYVLTEVNERGCHIVGYFSKEKLSVMGYNLACILTLPCHQKKGFGKLLISFSYALSAVELKVGSPEKPISDLGKVSYLSYWLQTLARILLSLPAGEQISITDLSKTSFFTEDDIEECLKHYGVLLWYRGKWVYSSSRLRELDAEMKERDEKQLARCASDPKKTFLRPVDVAKLHWVPFVVDKKRRAAVLFDGLLPGGGRATRRVNTSANNVNRRRGDDDE